MAKDIGKAIMEATRRAERNEETHSMVYGSREVFCLICGTHDPSRAPCPGLIGGGSLGSASS